MLRKSTTDITGQAWTWKSGIERRRAKGCMARASSQICNELDTPVEISRRLPRPKWQGVVNGLWSSWGEGDWKNKKGARWNSMAYYTHIIVVSCIASWCAALHCYSSLFSLLECQLGQFCQSHWYGSCAKVFFGICVLSHLVMALERQIWQSQFVICQQPDSLLL